MYLSSNAKKYFLSLRGCCTQFHTVVNGTQACLCFLISEPYISLEATPLCSEYCAKLHFQLDMRCNDCICLRLNFPKRTVQEVKNVFFLTDKTYGLPIDGNLYFRSV